MKTVRCSPSSMLLGREMKERQACGVVLLLQKAQQKDKQNPLFSPYSGNQRHPGCRNQSCTIAVSKATRNIFNNLVAV